MTFVALFALALRTVAAGPSETTAPGPHVALAAADHQRAPTFKAGRPLVGTTYFYWYDVTTGSHIRDHDGSDALTTHPPKDWMRDASWRSVDWHERQLRDMQAAGIDFLMPVYWGVPGMHEGWSNEGLAPLVEAHNRIEAGATERRGRRVPPIGMFYDTSTLRWNRARGADLLPGVHVDLTAPEGRAWFYATIRDFFSLVPPRKWARIDGRPIVFLYGADHAKAVDDKLFDDTRERFRRDFATDLFLVRNGDWPGRADAWYNWGGALRLTLGDVVAGIGPGYDHSAVPGRARLVTGREGGAFYERQWELLLRMDPASRPWMVHVETWNEWHEGTDVARSEEFGDQYIRLTAKYAELFRRGARLPSKGAYAGATQVSWMPTKPQGVTLVSAQGDGCWKLIEAGSANDVPAVRIIDCDPPQGARYIYFDVDDSFLFAPASNTNVELTIDFLDDGGCGQFRIDYDNHDQSLGPRAGAFRPAGPVKVGRTGAWRTETLRLENVRFVNATNSGDFRIAPEGGDRTLTIRSVVMKRAK